MSTDSLEKKAGISQADIKRGAAWAASILIVGAVGFAHGTLWSHESEIAVLKNAQGSIIRTQEQSERRADRIEAILHEILKELRK